MGLCRACHLPARQAGGRTRLCISVCVALAIFPIVALVISTVCRSGGLPKPVLLAAQGEAAD